MAGTYLVIDNYDSFTYNLVHCLGATSVTMDVVRNDAITVDEVAERRASGELAGLVLSPGPCTPDDAGICLDLITRLGANTPIFGVCLGMQSMGQAYGGKVVGAAKLMHGKVSSVTPSVEAPIFAGINGPFEATRYHSLAVETTSLPPDIVITARTDDGEIMGLSHRTDPVHGVQFHPESIASQHGERILANFVAIATRFNDQQAS
ncbi:MAG: aminodeoxychorismate/anthranilate synthase component II [Rhizobiales bacterium]|nr:aminodeoxychorismate/anthranilate synthase component II [Hyphomicrobiales bacterium]MBO6698026.1 aminodeoxychorismate/anthranilate synthase component II [Hyphomicrobiales bacterium]MBO6735720.1 aminodeoxychorismate/anthranilate synthase component II [Hyphomicrobiales bacterium]MBO6910472.1 aminodeoxychorismate/anthranilate synthase component II [Hyphomicrobiales bacterium]MBO6957194.1 aminodeoxychorismate/anthranilate synthase component II [Hyphomicrobiales bacterium]